MRSRLSVRRGSFATCLLFVLLGALLVLPDAAFASSGGVAAWIDSYNFGNGALILNPIIISIQWANFLILMVVLNKILYKPLRSLMEQREAKINGDLAAAERDRSEARGYVSQYEDSLAESQRENTEALIALQQEMIEMARKRLDKVRESTGHELDQARRRIAAEAKQAREQLEGRARELAAEIANRLAGRKIA